MFEIFGRWRPSKPKVTKPRHRCPFYGFHARLPEVLVDSNGNQCASLPENFPHAVWKGRGRSLTGPDARTTTKAGQNIFKNF